MEPTLKYKQYAQGRSIREHCLRLSQQMSIANSFVVRNRTSCPHPLLRAGILSGNSVYRLNGNTFTESLYIPYFL